MRPAGDGGEGPSVAQTAMERLAAGPATVLLAGFGVANRAVARALGSRGHTAVAVDDRPSPAAAAEAAEMSVDLTAASDDGRLRRLLAGADLMVPTPGLPDGHRALAAAADLGVPVASELDLARAWDARPTVAVTGTNGKTTVVDLVTAALEASGIRAAAAGNTGPPLVAAIDRADVEVFVVEASSFRLTHSRGFSPRVGCWLNFAPDHLDVHRDLRSYAEAKARVWSGLPPDGVAVAAADDPAVMGRLRPDRAAVTFSASGAADWRCTDGRLCGPDGPLMKVADLGRALPHDIANALAAAAVAEAAGASPEAVARALSDFEPTGHRIDPVAEIDGVVFYDDSSATTPHAALAAVAALGDPVLIAGGRNKGLDLAPLLEAAGRVRAVVSIGETADEIAEMFSGRAPAEAAADMDDAVARAAALARPGGAVVLSPACASFDWYSSCAERGDDFARAVRAHAEARA